MKRTAVIFIRIALLLFCLIGFLPDSYAGQATATASVIIIIPERDAQTEARLAADNTKQDTTQEEQQERVYAKHEQEQ